MVRAFEEPAFSPDLITGRKGLFIASLILAQKRDFVSELGKIRRARATPGVFRFAAFQVYRFTIYWSHPGLSRFALCRTPFSFGKGLFYAADLRG